MEGRCRALPVKAAPAAAASRAPGPVSRCEHANCAARATGLPLVMPPPLSLLLAVPLPPSLLHGRGSLVKDSPLLLQRRLQRKSKG